MHPRPATDKGTRRVRAHRIDGGRRGYGTRPTVLSGIIHTHLYLLNYEFCMQNSDREVHFQVSQFFEPLEGLDRGSS